MGSNDIFWTANLNTPTHIKIFTTDSGCTDISATNISRCCWWLSGYSTLCCATYTINTWEHCEGQDVERAQKQPPKVLDATDKSSTAAVPSSNAVVLSHAEPPSRLAGFIVALVSPGVVVRLWTRNFPRLPTSSRWSTKPSRAESDGIFLFVQIGIKEANNLHWNVRYCDIGMVTAFGTADSRNY